MPSLAELKALMAEQERQAAELRELFLKTQQEEEERLKKEEEERIRREAEEKQRKEAEEKRLAEEARVAELARKAEEERKRVEEEDRVRKASETTGSNRIDVNMTTESEWSRMSPPINIMGVNCIFSGRASGANGATKSVGKSSPSLEQNSGQKVFGSECGRTAHTMLHV